MASSARTMKSLLHRLRTDHADIVALRIKRAGKYYELTGAEAARRAAAVGHRLLALGLAPGDRVGLLSENRPEWGVAYLGIVSHGLTAVPLDRLLKPSEIRTILEDAGAAAAIVSEAFLNDIDAMKTSLPALHHLLPLDRAVEGDARPPPDITPAPDDPAVLIYTSGTTGRPKGVVLSHRNIMANVVACSKAISYTRGDNFLSVLPLHHTFECTAGLLAPLYEGATVTYVGSLKSRDILETMKETRATIMLGVPLLYEKMYAGIMRAVRAKPVHVRALFGLSMAAVKAVEATLGKKVGRIVFRGLREKSGFGTIRFFVSGAAALPTEVAQGFERLGIRILQGYGLTETSPVVAVNRYDAVKLDSIGPPIPGVEVKIDRPDESGVGEVVVRGENVMKGYYMNPEATREVLRDGWLYTGDSGWIDGDGYLHIAGRLKNVIVTQAGKNIYPEEIESVLIRSPYIAEVLVTGEAKENSREEIVRAIAVPDYDYFEQEAAASGVPVTDDRVEEVIVREVRARCASMADYKRVRNVEIRKEEFPKTSTRKIKRYLMKSQPVAVSS